MKAGVHALRWPHAALPVAFAGGRVVRLRLTAKAPLVALLGQQRAKAARAAVAPK